jgi:type I restriction enzyme S subunit
MPEGLSYTWKTKMLGTVCQLSGGYGFPDSLQGSIEGELPFIKVSDMSLPRNERVIVNANNYVSMRIADSMGWKPFPAGAVVFAKVGAALKLNRRRILIRPTLIDNNMMAAIPCGDLDSAFLYHFLCAIDFGDFVQDGALPSVNQEQIASIKIPNINKDEQHRIAEILDTIDEAIQQTEALISKLKAMKKGLLHDLLTRGLDKNGKLRDPKAHPEQFKDSPLGRIPKEWEPVRLLDLVSIPNGQVDPKQKPYCHWPLIAPDHIESHTGRLLCLETAIEQSAISGKYAFKPGDVLYSKIRPYLRKAVLADRQGLCSADMYPLQPGPSLVSRFLLDVILGEHFSRFASSVSERSGFPKINRKELGEYWLALPTQDEQLHIASVMDTHDARIRTEEQYRDKLKLQKKGLMHDLLTGKVKVKV